MAEQRRGRAVRTVHVDAFGVRDSSERWREDGRGAAGGGGGGGEAGQALRQAVHVDLDL